MNVFQQAAIQKQTDQERMLARYYSVLARIDIASPSESDREAFFNSMSELNKSESDAMEDYEAVQVAKRNVAWAASEAEAEARHRAANDVYLKVCAERQELNVAINAKVSAASGAKEQAFADSSRAQEAKGWLIRLNRSNPQIWQAVHPVAPVAPVAPVQAAAEDSAAKVKKSK